MLTAVLVLCTALPVGAYTSEAKNTADALYQLELFLGYGSGYGLDDSLTRYQGYVLLVRMLGKEEEAKAAGYSHPFTDVKAGNAYVSYAYKTGLTNGKTATSFGAKSQMTIQQFTVVCLRALGYRDGADGDFAYADAKTFAAAHGLEVSTAARFTRGACVEMFWSALHTDMKDSTQTLAEALIARGVFSQKDWENAERIQRSGITAGDTSGEKGTVPSGGTTGGGTTTGETTTGDTTGDTTGGTSTGDTTTGDTTGGGTSTGETTGDTTGGGTTEEGGTDSGTTGGGSFGGTGEGWELPFI